MELSVEDPEELAAWLEVIANEAKAANANVTTSARVSEAFMLNSLNSVVTIV